MNYKGIIGYILKALKPEIVKALKRIEKVYKQHTGEAMSTSELKYQKLYLVYDMVRSLEKYTNKNDKIISFEHSSSSKGNIKINAIIKRDGVEYKFNTTTIYAGGHTIQKLHFRYIVDTDLPRTNNSEITNKINSEIKRMSKIERINGNIKEFKKEIKKDKEIISKNKKISKKDIIEILKSADSWNTTTWKKIIRLGADKNYNGEKDFNDRMKKTHESEYKFWVTKNITWKEEHLNSMKDRLAKELKKLDKLK